MQWPVPPPCTIAFIRFGSRGLVGLPHPTAQLVVHGLVAQSENTCNPVNSLTILVLQDQQVAMAVSPTPPRCGPSRTICRPPAQD